MNKPKPILLNTEMVQAISNGYKLATRRRIDQEKYLGVLQTPSRRRHPEIPDEYYIKKLVKPQYAPGDILYVRETWSLKCCLECEYCNFDPIPGTDEVCTQHKTPIMHEDKYYATEGCYIYRADYPHPDRIIWRPSIHMPKAAARIWLEVTHTKIQRLQEMTLDDFLSEGVAIRPEAYNDPDNAYMQARHIFTSIWDSTIQPQDKDKYGWDANPWVWVYDFKRCEKPESEE